MTQYKKKCPKCGGDQIYKTRNILLQSIKKNTNCGSCASSEYSTGKNNGMYGKTHTKETIEIIKEKRSKQIITDETRKNMSESQIKRLSKFNHWNDRKHTGESRKKMRNSTIKYVESVKFSGGQMFPSYNKSSIPIIEQYGKDNGYSFQHAENGGEFHIKELGYWVDGYDVENNVVLEIDEPRHKYTSEKDKTRQKEITEFLKCKFIRIKI